MYDIGVDDGTRFIVMEHVAGRSAEAILRERHQLEPAWAVDVAKRVADALGAAHAAGIVHRDIKPGNVMIGDDGSVKVLDFGIARAMDGTALTHSAAVLGTAAYMAPEQVLGHAADERSDIYSLGCVLYAMLAGRPPFAGETIAAILHQQVNAEPRPLRELAPHLGDALNAVVLQTLAKSPAARPQSAVQLRERLVEAHDRPAAGSQAPTAPTARLARSARPPGPARVSETVPRAIVDAPSGGPRGARRRLAAAAGLAVVLGAVAVVLLAGGRSRGSGSSVEHHSGASKRTSSAVHAGRAAGPSAAAATTTTTSAQTPTPPSTTTAAAPQAPSVAASAGTLTALLSADAEAGSIQPHAVRALNSELDKLLGSYAAGHAANIQPQLAGLAQRIATLQRDGQLGAAAAPALAVALASLETAIGRSAPEAGTTRSCAGPVPCARGTRSARAWARPPRQRPRSLIALLVGASSAGRASSSSCASLEIVDKRAQRLGGASQVPQLPV